MRHDREPVGKAFSGVDQARPSSRRWDRVLRRRLARSMPKGLFARTILILVVPILILQSVIAFVYFERHTQTVTTRLSEALVRDISALVDTLERDDLPNRTLIAQRLATRHFGMALDIRDAAALPPPSPRPFFSLLDQTLSRLLQERFNKPFRLDTSSRDKQISIILQLDEGRIMEVRARRSLAYASNSHIFLVWVGITSLLLLVIALLFLRNQIRPIQQLADAADRFGKGQAFSSKFKPRGAREVRKASEAFLAMRRRIERHVEQRTAMLSGVSHDLSTILTRFKLSLAVLPDMEEKQFLQKDVEEMQSMLTAYLDFAKGAEAEKASLTNLKSMLDAIQRDCSRAGHPVQLVYRGDPMVTIKPNAFKRCLDNLVGNAMRHAQAIHIEAHNNGSFCTIHVDDDGPGIAPDQREDVFKPFTRLDEARNQDEGGTGLGLSIALDIARAHGGNIQLDESPLGGLRASVQIPV
jgi:two-component system osmolarity sensor histidine kinase EnvZ